MSSSSYLMIDPETEYVHLIIPAQKFRPDECEKDAKVRITVNDHSEIRDLPREPVLREMGQQETGGHKCQEDI